MDLRIQKINSGKKGMTLLEVLFTMVIFSVIILAFFPLFSYTARIITKSGRIIDASYVASSVLENMYNESKNPAVGIPADSVTEDWDQLEGKYWVRKDIKVDGRQVNVIVMVYTDETKDSLQAQMELHLLWHS